MKLKLSKTKTIEDIDIAEENVCKALEDKEITISEGVELLKFLSAKRETLTVKDALFRLRQIESSMADMAE